MAETVASAGSYLFIDHKKQIAVGLEINCNNGYFMIDKIKIRGVCHPQQRISKINYLKSCYLTR